MTRGNYSVTSFLSEKLVLTIAVLILSTANLNAGVIIDVNTNTDPVLDASGAPNSQISSSVGSVSAPTITGMFGTSSVISATYTVSGVDLSSIEAGATNASFDFTLQYEGFNVDAAGTRTGASIGQFINGSRNNVSLGVGNTNINPNQEITVTQTGVTNISGFTGSISGFGFDQVVLANAGNEDDAATVVFGDGTSFSFDNGGTAGSSSVEATAGLVSTDNFTVSGDVSLVRLGLIGVQFEAIATAVPEPSSMVALGFGALGILVRRRRNS